MPYRLQSNIQRDAHTLRLADVWALASFDRLFGQQVCQSQSSWQVLTARCRSSAASGPDAKIPSTLDALITGVKKARSKAPAVDSARRHVERHHAHSVRPSMGRWRNGGRVIAATPLAIRV